MVRSFLKFDSYRLFREIDYRGKGYIDATDLERYLTIQLGMNDVNVEKLMRFWTNLPNCYQLNYEQFDGAIGGDYSRSRIHS